MKTSCHSPRSARTVPVERPRYPCQGRGLWTFPQPSHRAGTRLRCHSTRGERRRAFLRPPRQVGALPLRGPGAPPAVPVRPETRVQFWRTKGTPLRRETLLDAHLPRSLTARLNGNTCILYGEYIGLYTH